MNKKDLNKAIDLEKLITQTQTALNTIESWIGNSQELNVGGNYKCDFNYNLYISQYSDQSGKSLNLCRYFGNTKILEIIRDELIKQLQEFEKDFEKM